MNGSVSVISERGDIFGNMGNAAQELNNHHCKEEFIHTEDVVCDHLLLLFIIADKSG